MPKHAPITALAAAAALALAGCSSDGSQHSDSHGSGTSSSSSSSAAGFNQADVTYAQGMSMHHQQAVEMSDILLEKDDVDADVADLARQIKKAQGPEIKKMQGWLEDWGHPMEHGGHGSDPSIDGDHMDGMISSEDIAELKKADGPQASRLFLDQMIEHHEGAVDMAEKHLEAGKNADALALSKAVVKDQKAEITTMQQMRKAL